MSIITSLVSLPMIQRDHARTIFTHGTFDLFHVGHLSFLREAKRLGGLLVVGIDHDENLIRYKRKREPVFSLDYRVRIVASLDFVDVVLPLPKILPHDGLDYHYLKLYLHVRPYAVASGLGFPFSRQVREKCALIGARYYELAHPYAHLSTSSYIRGIIEGGSRYTPQ